MDYFSLPGLNWSLLKSMDESPLHFKHARANPRLDTADLKIGRYTHALVFEPETVARDYAIWNDGDRRGKAWEAFRDENVGKTIFKPNEVSVMEAMAHAVRTHPLVAPLLEGGVYEKILRWTDADTGFDCKCKADWIVPKKKTLIDFKTTRCVETRRFGRDVATYKYPCQLAHYGNGIKAVYGSEPEMYMIIAVEKTAPYDVGVFVLDEGVINAGREQVAALMAKVAECEASGKWPGRHEEPVNMDSTTLPGWFFGGGDPEIEFIEEEE